MAMAWLAAATATAGAQELTPIVDDDFTLDLYQGPVLGSGRIVSMGGAQVGMASGAAGMAFNPAAPAVRPATSNDTWDWDWNLDWLNPEIGDDFDNNGIASEQRASPVFTGGIIVRYGRCGFGFSGDVQNFRVETDTDTFRPEIFVARLGGACSFRDDEWTVGLQLKGASFTLFREAAPRDEQIVSVSGAGPEAGVVWRPRWLPLRAGVAASVPVAGKTVVPSDCDVPEDPNEPTRCPTSAPDDEQFIVPGAVDAPWELGLGVAWRFAKSQWNRQIDADFRDEKAVVVAADVKVSGAVDNGAGLQAYTLRQLQRSGESTVVSLRLGAEYEWVPGRFRVRGGTYWEPARFAGVSGRLHLTLGFDVRLFSFRFLDDPYRVRLSLTSDAADNYGNAGLSIGFWH